MESQNLLTIDDWKAFAEAKLPGKCFVHKRNRKITCIYAQLYNEHPHLFKWAGMASFASNKVGEALRPFSFYCDKEGAVKEDICHEYAFEVMDDLNVIRYTNNNVYNDIAWAHFAYLSGGIDLLKNLLEGNKDYEMLLEGFINIDRGRKIFESGEDPTLVQEYIWNGNALLLKHEQINTVQPMFTKLDYFFRKFLCLATAMDFDADNHKRDRKTYSSFYIYMWLRGTRLLLKTRSFPSIVNFEHRWLWIDKRMLKTWKKVDETQEYVRSKISVFLNAAIA